SGTAWARPPRIVIGDRFGRSAASRFTARLTYEARREGFTVSENSPYAGGYILDRHGRPERGIHALQIEIDRSLYLKADLRTPDDEAVSAMAGAIRAMVDALADEALGS